jgi:hypothetical protein
MVTNWIKNCLLQLIQSRIKMHAFFIRHLMDDSFLLEIITFVLKLETKKNETL